MDPSPPSILLWMLKIWDHFIMVKITTISYPQDYMWYFVVIWYPVLEFLSENIVIPPNPICKGFFVLLKLICIVHSDIFAVALWLLYCYIQFLLDL